MESNNKSKPNGSYIFKRTGKSVRNRIVLAAMTNKQSYDNGILSNDEIKWLTRRAKGGFGIITTAAANISKNGQAWEGELGVFDDIHIDKLKLLTDAVHSYESLIIAQLFHGGMHSPQSLTGKIPISASKIKCKESYSGFTHPASEKDINNIIENFTSAATRCVQSGFDGIELHGAHGYLISQFLGKKTNTRTDKWGGDIIGRSRLLIQIIKSIKKNVPDSFLVGVRVSPEIMDMGIHLDDSINLVGLLSDEGVDFIHLSCWNVFLNSQCYPKNPKTLTELIIESYNNLPAIISTGSVWSSDDAQKLIRIGADFVGVARVGIAYPDWPKKISNIEYNPPLPPYSINYLKKVDLSENFINYMRKWDGFVIETEGMQDGFGFE